MLLSELEKILRGCDVIIQYKEFQPRYKVMEFGIKICEIKDLPQKYLNAKVLRINLDDEIPSIFIEME